MFPTSLLGIVLSLAFLTPGFVFLQRRELRHPSRQYSVLRETSIVVVTSSALNAVSFLLLLLPSELISSPSMNRLFGEGGSYFALRHRRWLIWGATWLVLSCVLAFYVAVPPRFRRTGVGESSGRLASDTASNPLLRERWRSWTRSQRGTAQLSATGWSMALDRDCGTDEVCRVGIVDVDGRYLEGDLVRFSPNLDEDAHRSITLGGPLRLRNPDGAEIHDLTQHRLVVAADRVALLYVSYLKRSTNGDDSSETRGPLVDS